MQMQLVWLSLQDFHYKMAYTVNCQYIYHLILQYVYVYSNFTDQSNWSINAPSKNEYNDDEEEDVKWNVCMIVWGPFNKS